uniref:Uncharacterized protein n=1 Tax=Malurus cyaneus samueli TaxID=2593467 RepID=A0A8C5T6X1_9PASS
MSSPPVPVSLEHSPDPPRLSPPVRDTAISVCHARCGTCGRTSSPTACGATPTR